MTEKRIQHDLIMWFSQEYPQHRGLLFEVNNDTYNQNHAMTRRSMGMISGVSDLILINPHDGTVFGIEIKAPGSRHRKAHIENQLNWGAVVRNSGGMYIMSSDLEVLKDAIELTMAGNHKTRDSMVAYHLLGIMSKMKGKGKSVVF